MTPKDWLIDLINDNGHLAWVRLPCIGGESLRAPELTWHWPREDFNGDLYLLVSHPDLPRVYRAEEIPTMRPVWGEQLTWEAV